MTHNPQQVYAILQTFTASLTQGTMSAQPLFHAVSLMGKKGGYLIWYLPQHCDQAGKVLDLITTLLPGLQIQYKPRSHRQTGAPRETTNATQPKTPIITRSTPVPPNQPLQMGAPMPKEQQKDKLHIPTKTGDKNRIQAQHRIESLGHTSLHLSDSTHHHKLNTNTDRPTTCCQAPLPLLATNCFG